MNIRKRVLFHSVWPASRGPARRLRVFHAFPASSFSAPAELRAFDPSIVLAHPLHIFSLHLSRAQTSLGARWVPSKDDAGRLNPRDFAVAGAPHRLANPHRTEEIQKKKLWFSSVLIGKKWKRSEIVHTNKRKKV
jgi:hypothetical protein